VYLSARVLGAKDCEAISPLLEDVAPVAVVVEVVGVNCKFCIREFACSVSSPVRSGTNTKDDDEDKIPAFNINLPTP
jgi:hypothetical protein